MLIMCFGKLLAGKEILFRADYKPLGVNAISVRIINLLV
jgi:hypothetical protein